MTFVLRNKWWLSLFLAAFLVVVSACGGSDDGEGESSSQKSGKEQGSAAGAGLDDVPDVVAEVNGEELPKSEFVSMYEAQLQQMSQQAQASGQPVDQDALKEQVVESMISTELLVQEAEKRNISATDEEVDQTLQGLAQQNGLKSVDALMKVLEEQGMDSDEVQSQVKVQVQVDELIADEAGDVEPTDKQVQAFYQQMVAQQEQAGAGGKGAQGKIPPLEQVRPQVEEQLKSQQRNAVAQTLVGDLREAADVVVNL